MRTMILIVWLAMPIAALAYHFGPGQQRLALNDATLLLAKADRLVAEEDWHDAVEVYNEALALLPKEDQAAIWRVRLERNKVQMLASQLPDAHRDLKALVQEMNESLIPGSSQDGSAAPDTDLHREARAALANAQYYITWLMRLEGVPREEWEPEIESARENLKLLAAEAEDRGDQVSLVSHQEDLESAIRLARMDLKDLQGLPLPSQ